MKIIICLRCNDTKIVRNIIIRHGWFGRTYATVQGVEHEISSGSSLTLDIPIAFGLTDLQPEELNLCHRR